jgi:5'-nucleotidase
MAARYRPDSIARSATGQRRYGGGGRSARHTFDRGHDMLRRTTGIVATSLLVIGGMACSSSGSDASGPTSARKTSTTVSTSTAKPPALTVVVTDDDGIDAGGIDELAKQIGAIPGVTVHVVAPATNQSGTGDKTTPGGAKYHAGTTASGIKGTAVVGTPADSVGVALDDLGLKPDLVASGINKGQNIGPLAAISGTVGAALTAARRKIPAVAGSAGFGEHPDYASAAKLVVAWIIANRVALAAHRMPTTAIVNFNVPDCTKGTMRPMVQAPLAAAIPKGVSPFTTDCSAEPATTKPANDVEALVNGYAVQSDVSTN